MRDPSVKSYFAPFELNTVLGGGGVSRVLKSASPALQPGDIAVGFIGWETYTKAPAAAFQKVTPLEGVPLSYYLSVLGMPSMTAYVGELRLKELKPPTAGETVYISGAAGAVGQVCGQIAKMQGCRVIGSAGSDDKVEFIKAECGYDEGGFLELEKRPRRRRRFDRTCFTIFFYSLQLQETPGWLY